METKSITEQIMEWANSRKGGNSLIDWSDQIINTFDTDTIINYGGLLLIIWGLLSIILMYSGSYVIDRFQLRGRNYYLDRFIDYRLKLLPYLIKFEVGSIVLILLLTDLKYPTNRSWLLKLLYSFLIILNSISVRILLL